MSSALIQPRSADLQSFLEARLLVTTEQGRERKKDLNVTRPSPTLSFSLALAREGNALAASKEAFTRPGEKKAMARPWRSSQGCQEACICNTYECSFIQSFTPESLAMLLHALHGLPKDPFFLPRLSLALSAHALWPDNLYIHMYVCIHAQATNDRLVYQPKCTPASCGLSKSRTQSICSESRKWGRKPSQVKQARESERSSFSHTSRYLFKLLQRFKAVHCLNALLSSH